jgi:hypothetical protein
MLHSSAQEPYEGDVPEAAFLSWFCAVYAAPTIWRFSDLPGVHPLQSVTSPSRGMAHWSGASAIRFERREVAV